MHTLTSLEIFIITFSGFQRTWKLYSAIFTPCNSQWQKHCQILFNLLGANVWRRSWQSKKKNSSHCFSIKFSPSVNSLLIRAALLIVRKIIKRVLISILNMSESLKKMLVIINIQNFWNKTRFWWYSRCSSFSTSYLSVFASKHRLK